MKKHPWYLIIMAFAFIVMGSVGTAQAKGSYMTSFNSTYPAAPTAIKTCNLCHPGGDTGAFNFYADAYAGAGHQFAPIESLDSDGDGFTNITEINAGSFPGDAASKPVASPPPVAATLVSIAISGPASVNESTTATYTATATMSDNTTKAVTATWSENSTFTTISAAGLLTASAVTANQAVTVSASYTEGGITKTASYAVTVVDVPVTPPPATVTLASIAISGPASVNESATGTYTATATMSNGTTKAVTAKWSENSTFTTISAGGVLTASAVTANQAVVVSASYSEGGITKTATYAVTVVDVPVTPPSTADSDGDGMPNGFEQAYGLNPNDPTDAGLDPDGDGLTNLEEFKKGTHPKSPDSDGDGFWDGADLVPNDKARPLIDEKGQHRYGAWFMDDGNKQWNGDKDLVVTNFGAPKDLPVVGDWNGDGIDKIGVFRNGQWYLDSNANDSWDPGVDIVAVFGAPTDLPVAGDWNGDGKAKIGVYRGGTWYLDNGNGQWDAGIDSVAVFGAPTDLPVAGDINGDGKAEIGVYRPSTGMWYFDRDNNGFWSGCDVDLCAGPFGGPSDLPVIGDWDGNGTYEVGVYRQGVWYLDNGNIKWDPQLDKTYNAFGASYDVPVIGDWNNDGKSDIGTFR
mgnify:CR=1 FL=1